MSTTQTPARESYPCTVCDDEFAAGTAFHGSYCSAECYYRHKGRDIIRDIKQDHRWCATCFRPLKEVEEPPEGHSVWVEGPRGRPDENVQEDVLVGYQYRTETTEWVVDEQDMPNAFLPLEHSRWGCDCGAVDPSTQSDTLRHVHAETVIDALYACLEQLAAEDNVAHEPSRGALFDALREEPWDWPHAAGAAIYAD